MTIQYINTGTSPNKGNGDSLRLAFHKINQNFDYIMGSDQEASYKLIRDNNTATQVVLQEDGRLTIPGPIYQGTAWDGIDYTDTIFRADTDTNSFAQFLIQNHNNGIDASTDLVLMNNLSDSFDNIIDLGINSSNYNSPAYSVTGPGDGYLYVSSGNLAIGTQSPNKKLIFHAGGTTVNSSGGYLDDYAWHFNRSVQVDVPAPGPLNFTVTNPLNNSVASAVYQAINDAGRYAQFGIYSSNSGVQDGNIGPGEVFLHGHDAGNTTHIGNKTNMALYSDRINGFAGTATLFLDRDTFKAVFRGNVLPNDDGLQYLGFNNKHWRQIFVSSEGIYIGDTNLTTDGLGHLLVNGVPLTGGAIISSEIPITPANGQIWWNNDTGDAYIYYDDGNSSQWVSLSNSNSSFVYQKVYVSDSAPTQNIVNGNLWFNGNDGRLYVRYSDIWTDASPQVTPPSILPTDDIGVLTNDGAGNLSWTSSGFDLSAVNQSIVPATNNLYDLGSTSSQWRSLYVGTSTIYLGGTALSVNQNGDLLVDGSLVTGGGGSPFTGTVDENTTTSGVHIGLHAGSGTPRVIFANGTTSTWEIDNNGGELRIFQPGNVAVTVNADHTVSFDNSIKIKGVEDNSTSVVDFFPNAPDNHRVILNNDWTMKLQARAGGGNEGHLWLEAGQNNRIKINGNGSNIQFTAGNGTNTSTWTLDSNGNFALPYGSKLVTFDTASVELTAGNDPASYASLASYNASNYAWVDNNGAYIATNWTGTSHTWTFGTDGSATLPTVIAGDTSIGTAFNTNPPGHTLTLKHNSGVNGGSGGELKFDYGNAQIKVVKDAGITRTWTFDSDGAVTFPSGAGFILGENNQLKTNDTTTSKLDFRDSTGRGFYTGDDGFTVRSNGTYNWIFGIDGDLTIPNGIKFSDASIQTTAFTGTIEVLTVGVGGLVVNGPVTFNDPSFTYQGTATVVVASSGTFYGDTYGVGALYAGVAGSEPLPSTVIQSAANVNAYIQNNFQNLNTGVEASTEWVATANNGDDSNHYIDLGIAGGGWDGSQSNSVGTAAQANDSWVYAQGSTSTSAGGNLILGTIKDGKSIKLLTGSNGASSISASFNSSGLTLNTGTIVFPDNTTQSTAYTGTVAWSNITGAPNVTGYTGSAGTNGATGYTGSVGTAGSAGATGYTGSIGYVGSSGNSTITAGTGTAVSTVGNTTTVWLSNNSVTIGTTSVALGNSTTTLSGMSSIDGTTTATLFPSSTTLTLGVSSNTTSTLNISNGAVGTGVTKTINVGTGGVTGGTTNINIGTASGTSLTTINGTVSFASAVKFNGYLQSGGGASMLLIGNSDVFVNGNVRMSSSGYLQFGSGGGQTYYYNAGAISTATVGSISQGVGMVQIDTWRFYVPAPPAFRSLSYSVSSGTPSFIGSEMHVNSGSVTGGGISGTASTSWQSFNAGHQFGNGDVANYTFVDTTNNKTYRVTAVYITTATTSITAERIA